MNDNVMGVDVGDVMDVAWATIRLSLRGRVVFGC